MSLLQILKNCKKTKWFDGHNFALGKMELKNICALPSFPGIPEVLIGEMLCYMDGDMIFLIMQLCKPLKETIIKMMKNQPGFVIENRHQYMVDEAYFCFKRLKIPMNVKVEYVDHEEYLYQEIHGTLRVVIAEGKRTLVNGLENSLNDKPSFNTVWFRRWTSCGHLSRGKKDAPAIIYSHGESIWVQNNRIHRDGNLPAIVCANSSFKWYHHGVFIR